MTISERIRAMFAELRASRWQVSAADWPNAPLPYGRLLDEYHAELELSRMWRKNFRRALEAGDANEIAAWANARFHQALCAMTARERLHALRRSNLERAF
jgi:hypothetical protein